MTRGVQHHFHNALHISICGLEGADVNSQPAGDGGTDLPGIELFTFYFAALQDICSQRLQYSFLPKTESKGFHAADKSALKIAHVGEWLGETFPIPVKPRPVGKLVNI